MAPTDDEIISGVRSTPKLIRVVHVLDTVHHELQEPLDAPACSRLVQAYRALLIEVASDVDEETMDEMVVLGLRPLDDGASQQELRIAYAQLRGWAQGALRIDVHARSVVEDPLVTDAELVVD